MNIHRNYPLVRHNTFGIDVRAAKFVEYSYVAELKDALRDLASADAAGKYLFLGGGSNLLFTKDFDGTVLHSAIRGIEIIDTDERECLVRAGAGEVWDDLVTWALNNHLYGLENLSYIPGEVGASAVQNIGAYGVEASDVIERVETIDTQTLTPRIFTCAECDYSYRGSFFKKYYGRYAVHHVVFRLRRTFVPQLKYKALQEQVTAAGGASADEIRAMVIEMRRGKLPEPAEVGSAGSFFMNPVVEREKYAALAAAYPQMPHYVAGDMVKIPAAWLIEQCGWKGRKVGHVGVYPHQPLVLVNYGGAWPNEIVRLAESVIADVDAKFGIRLRPEVQYV